MTPKGKKEYGNNSITSLKGPDRVRLRPGVIFGSDGLDGCCHAMFEILSNAIDEAREGYGNLITVIRHKGGAITIKDNGRGIPVDYNEAEGMYNYQLVFEEMYAGGKYNNNEAESYEYSLGLNGLGLCATQYASEYMDAEVKRDGFIYRLHFEKGFHVGELEKKEDSSKGTYSHITFKPDREVFTDIDISLDYYMDIIKRQAVTNKGIKFVLIDEASGENFVFKYEDGILDYVKEKVEEEGFTKLEYRDFTTVGKDREDKPEYKVKAEIVFCFSNKVNLIEYYHNSSFLEYGGSPDKAMKSAFLYVIDKYLKNNNRYLKSEKKIIFQDIQESLIYVSSSFSTMTSYENQTKKSITNKFIQDAISDFLKQQLEIYFIENKETAEKIATQILINKRSRENAENTRAAIKTRLSSGLDPLNKVKKFVDCRSKDTGKRELYIVEGDSALGACKLGRDAEFQAIIPIRGKILNCLKADYNKIFANEIITDIIKILGTGVEVKSKHIKELSEFNLNNLRWDKIIICTDADVDGYQIRTLLLTMFYVLTPTLIEEGKIYIADSPLFEITSGNKTFFAYNENEKQKLIKTFKGKYHIQRSKGLGENNPDMMWETTMNPKSRKLIQITSSEAEDTKRTFEILLGDDLTGRKDYIENYGHIYIDQIDEI